jgi:hypothetical protein
MAGIINLCNRALSAVGMRGSIEDLNEGSPEANACSRFFESTRDELLAKAWWNGARKTAVLALSKASPGTPENSVPSTSAQWSPAYPAPPWLYEYLLPADCISPRYVAALPSSAIPAVPIFSSQTTWSLPLVQGAAIKFVTAIGADPDGNNIKVLLTNQSQAILVYTAKIVDTELWDPGFEQAFVYSLAGYIAIPLTGEKGIARANFDVANQKIAEARASDGNEGLTMQETMPDWLQVRGVGYDVTYGTAPIGPNAVVS